MAYPVLEKKYVKSKIALLNSSLQDEASSESEKEKVIRAHLAAVEEDSEFVLDPEFPPSLDWFNTSSPLSFSGHLAGKIVVLDFFTYCCINCIHVLPQLHALEEAHSVQGGVVVVGVHSAKFGNEKVSENIRNAIERYGMTHPVVNDAQIELWERLGVTCWPTLVIISPQRHLLHYIIGEGHGEELRIFMDVAVRYYQEKGSLSSTEMPIGLAEVKGRGQGEGLKYPGKVCFDNVGERLFVSDSTHHRVLVVHWKTGKLLKVYGSGEAGLTDGSATTAQFNTPQGLAYSEDTLYVADTENHALRKVDLVSGSVSTLAGTGKQGNDKEGGAVGVAQELSSPWDVEVGKSPGWEGEGPDVLYVAMAGTHQIWLHFLQDSTWSKGKEYCAGTSVRLSGSGEEANRNNSYPHKAGFAQPSGISLSPDATTLYVADSESSTVRGVALPGGSVKALVGGAIDPLDLFAFGDEDGKGRGVRLQHPLGVACRRKDGLVYVADSYNHKIKVVNASAKTCVTLAGKGSPGMEDGRFEHAQFSEPGGLCLDAEEKLLVVADTNNHAIRVLDLEKETVTKYEILFADGVNRLTGKKAVVVTLDPLLVPVGDGRVELKISFAPPTSCHWTEGAPSAWQVLPEDDGLWTLSGDEQVHSLSDTAESTLLILTTSLKAGQLSRVQVEAALYYCETDSGVCHMKAVILCLPLQQSNTCEATISKEISYSPEIS